MIDSLAFVPQRRRRVFVVAALHNNPRDVLLSGNSLQEHGVITSTEFEEPCGFYWTEGKYAIATAKSPTGLLPKGCQLECPVLPGQRPPFSTLSEMKNTAVTACFRKRLSQTPSRISKSEITENCRNIWWRTAFRQSWIKRHGSWHRLLRQGIHRTSRHRMSGIRLQGNCSAEYAVSLTAIIIIRPPISSPLPHTDV